MKYIVSIVFCFITYTTIQRATSRIIVFCNVGQGSAAFIQVGYTQVLVDTGPNRAVLACLGKHMPLFDNTLEYVIISHPQKDHDGGLTSIAERYSIQHIIGHTTYSFIQSHTFLKENEIVIKVANVHITAFKASQKPKTINESTYVVTIYSPKDIVFLSSDISGWQLKKLIPPKVTIFSVPHHGSKNGMYTNSLLHVSPRLAVISVGKNNYGHPHKKVISYLQSKKIQIWRTDLQGELILEL